MITKSVPLSGGLTVEVGKLKWSAYKALKTEVLRRLSREFPLVMASLSDGSGSKLMAVAELVGKVAGEVLSQLEELFLKGCLVGADVLGNLDELSFADMQALLSAAQELNPIDEILAWEGNSPGGTLLLRLKAMLPQGQKPDPDLASLASGGSVWSPSSPEPTDGAPETSPGSNG